MESCNFEISEKVQSDLKNDQEFLFQYLLHLESDFGLQESISEIRSMLLSDKIDIVVVCKSKCCDLKVGEHFHSFFEKGFNVEMFNALIKSYKEADDMPIKQRMIEFTTRNIVLTSERRSLDSLYYYLLA